MWHAKSFDETNVVASQDINPIKEDDDVENGLDSI
jgi:hypothetical protein